MLLAFTVIVKISNTPGNFFFSFCRARSSRCCGLTLSHGLVLHIGITSLHLSPLDRNVQEKLLRNEMFI